MINPIKKIKKIILLIVFFFFILVTTFFLAKIYLFNSNKNEASLTIENEETLINEIKNTNKIIPLEVELSKTIKIDKSWGSLDIFKKYKKIKFFANCSYYIDLSNISKDNINMDYESNTLNITVPSPKVFTVDIIQDKTLYEESSNGLLRFGEILVTAEEFELIQSDVLKNFEETMMDNDLYNKAINNSKISLNNLLKQILGEDISININFK